ncbi:MAG: hypothetical protein HKL89_01315 [Candidatus Dormibacteraeota bacterium]|nr:hypothetical protein [Candidatus Dormibacteraeota bacterium]
MIGEKIQHFQGKHSDLGQLQGQIEEYLKGDGFKVQTSAPSVHGTLIQAKKGGFLQGIIDADRALTILIDGESDDFTVRTGVGKWLEHLGVAAVETLLLSELFLVVDVAEMAWNVEIEGKLAKKVAELVG